MEEGEDETRAAPSSSRSVDAPCPLDPGSGVVQEVLMVVADEG